jgi:hypothetical protein
MVAELTTMLPSNTQSNLCPSLLIVAVIMTTSKSWLPNVSLCFLQMHRLTLCPYVLVVAVASGLDKEDEPVVPRFHTGMECLQ